MRELEKYIKTGPYFHDVDDDSLTETFPRD